MDFVESLYKNFITQMNVLRRQIGSLLIENGGSQVSEISKVLDHIDQAIEQANLGTSWMSQDLLKITQLLLQCKENVNQEDTESLAAWTACWKIINAAAMQLCEDVDDEYALQIKEISEEEIG